MPERARKTRPGGRSKASRRFRRVRAVFSVVLGSTVQPGSASGAKVGVRVGRDVATRAKVRHFTFSLNRFRQNSAPHDLRPTAAPPLFYSVDAEKSSF
jgi:hypothetical protein